MRSERGRQLIERFLGEGATRDGPFGLLGIDPAECTASGVEAALERQLDRVSHHADAETSEADEVRLVLDTAATELLDPVSRAKWVEALRAERVVVEAGLEPAFEAEPAPERAAHETDATDGTDAAESRDRGDPLVKRMLVMLGVGFGLLVLGTGLGAWLLTTAPGGTQPPSVVAGGVPAPVTPSAGAATKAAAVEEPTPPPLAPLRIRGRSEFADGDHVVRELRGAAADLATDPDRALARFDRAYAAGADWWCRYDTAQVRAAADAVVECVYRASARPDHLSRLLAMVTEPVGALQPEGRGIQADEVWPAAWSAGILARMNRERDLSPQLTASIGQALGRVFARARPSGELTLESGTAAALKALPAAILAGKPARGDGAEQANKAAAVAMQRWVEAVTLSSGGDADRRERYLVDALSWCLTEAAEPDADARVFDAVTMLAAETKWRAGGPGRARLIEWFRDPRVSNNDLRAVTSAIATRSSAEGVDQSMVLSMSAKGDDRLKLRAKYAAAWGLAEASTRADSARMWITRAQGLADVVPREDELDQLAAAADLAELSREATRIWRGEGGAGAGTGAPSSSGTRVAPAVPAHSTGSSKLAQPMGARGGGAVTAGGVTGGARDGAWAERYLAAERNIPVRLERLAELEQIGPPIGWIDAAVLTEAACFGSPVQIRAAAQKAVGLFAEEPAMVSAFLDALPNLPRVKSVSETVARVGLTSLPRASDADWELLARRALVERLLSMLAEEGGGIHGQIEQLATRIAAAYLDAAGEPGPDAAADASATGARRGAELLVDAARREAEGLPISSATRFSLEQIMRRREQRRAQAIGPVQAFGAEQAALAETLGYLVAIERPEREQRVGAVIDEMAAERRKARHVFAQIWAAERAIVRIWLLRLGEGKQT